MRYLWAGALLTVVLFASACSGPAVSTTRTTLLHPVHRHPAATTTTITTPVTKLASGPRDLSACSSFKALSRDIGQKHSVVVTAFQRMFRALRHAENSTLRVDGHRMAVALLTLRISAFKRDFEAIYLTCYSMQVGTPTTG